MSASPPNILDVHGDTSRPVRFSFQQHRVTMFLRVLATFFGLFLLLGGVKYFAVAHSGQEVWLESVRLGSLLFAAIFGLVVAMWAFVHRHPRSQYTLNIIDSAGTVTTCGALTAMIPIMPFGTGELGIGYVLILVLVIRAGIVPSTGRRTLIVGLLATAPLAAVLYVRGMDADPTTQPIVHFAGTIVLLWGIIFSIATLVISKVIYGLHTRLRTLGSYRLVERLGSGGMGDVWRAEHEMLARPAAVKMVRAESMGSAGDSASSLERFEREAQATASLSCPNTIHLYDFGRAADGSFYYVMELIDGIDLDSLVKRHGPQSANRVCHILQQICRSLHEAHLIGLVHRDVKPANILLCRYGTEQDFVKVLDFGLVKQHAEPVNTGLTRDGIAVGTPAYMAPEMVLGEREIDGRADLYAVGCVGYWLLTGTLVFESDKAGALLVKHASEEPVPPSRRTELDVPDSLEQIIMACLQKAPEKRPESARELRQQLIACDIPWSEIDAEEWWRLHHPG